MSLRSTLRKAAGLLVELPPDEEEAPAQDLAVSQPPTAQAGDATDKMWAELEKAAQPPRTTNAPAPTKTVEQIVREAEGPNLDEIQVNHERLPADSAQGSMVDLAAIYQAAHLPAVPYTAEQALEMLASLPADLPLDTRRKMMKAALDSMGKAIGATPESIVTDASRKLAALADYTDNLTKLSTEYSAISERKIAALQAQIEETRQAMATAQARQVAETQRCAAESHRLDEVLEFFSLDVPPSKYADQNETPAPSSPPPGR